MDPPGTRGERCSRPGAPLLHGPVPLLHGPVAQFRIPISNFQCPISTFWFPISSFWCPISTFQSPFSDIRLDFPTSGSYSLASGLQLPRILDYWMDFSWIFIKIFRVFFIFVESLLRGCISDVFLRTLPPVSVPSSFGAPTPTRVLLHEYRGLRGFTFFRKRVLSRIRFSKPTKILYIIYIKK